MENVNRIDLLFVLPRAVEYLVCFNKGSMLYNILGFDTHNMLVFETLSLLFSDVMGTKSVWNCSA